MSTSSGQNETLVVEARGVRRVYPGDHVALDGVDLEVRAGGWVALLGANGAGKSTLLRIIATLDASFSGKVRLLGHTLPGECNAVRTALGVVFQSPSLDRLLTVRENLRLQGALHGVERDETDRRIDSMSRQLGFADRLTTRVGALSGGLMRRVDLARALLAEPELLILDEATAGLDPNARMQFFEHLSRVREQRAMSVVMSTHHVDEAERCDRVVMMSGGAIVADESIESIRGSFHGERTLECSIAGRDLVQAAGCSVREAGGRLVARGSGEQLGGVAQRLIESGVEVRVSTTNLADLYLEETGNPLEAESGVDP